MQVILLERIGRLGQMGDVVKVKDGYARNYLLPKKLACPATQKNLNFYRTLIEAKQKKLAKAKSAADVQAEKLSGESLSFVRKSRQDGRLFGSVTTADIAAELERRGYEIDKKRLSLSEPIKKIGEYKASVRLHPEVSAQMTVTVKSEEEAEDAGGK